MSISTTLRRQLAYPFCVFGLCVATDVAAQEKNIGLVDGVAELRETVRSLSERIEALESRPEWPTGKYCVLRYGSCPNDFSQRDSHMLALYMFRGGNTRYLRAGDLGDSYIRWHGDRSKDDADFHGEIGISVCCKEQ